MIEGWNPTAFYYDDLEYYELRQDFPEIIDKGAIFALRKESEWGGGSYLVLCKPPKGDYYMLSDFNGYVKNLMTAGEIILPAHLISNRLLFKRVYAPKGDEK